MATDASLDTAQYKALRRKLNLMMFVQIFIWGAWFEIGFSYFKSLGFSTMQQNAVFWAFNAGAIFALLFSTQFADRKFSAEKFLGVSHLIGGGAMLGLFFVHPAPGQDGDFWPIFLFMLLYSLFYVPTISITNSIAFTHLKDPAREFGPVRVWGTIGWIAASWPFIFLLVNWAAVPKMGDVGFINWLGAALGTPLKGADLRDGQRYAFLVAAIGSFVLAAISPSLPHTPPKPATGSDSFAALKAIKFLRHPFVFVLFLVTFIDAAVHQSFFYWTFDFLEGPMKIPANWVGPVMKIGQIAEILTMLALGWVLKSLGWRMTMTLGVLGHAARFAVFAYYPEPWAAVTVNVLHGICYAFFFATVYIFVDAVFPKDTRSSAQGLFNLLIVGLGPVAGTLMCGELAKQYSVGKSVDYPIVFQYSMAAGLIGALLLLLFFHPPEGELGEPKTETPEEQAPPVA